MSRYRRLVPHAQRRLVVDNLLARLNWFVGAAEQPLTPRDPVLTAEIDRVKARIRKRREGRTGGEVVPDVVPQPVEAPVVAQQVGRQS